MRPLYRIFFFFLLVSIGCKSSKQIKNPSPVLVTNLNQVDPELGKVRVEGYRVPGDGGEGQYRWQWTRMIKNDGGMYVASSVRKGGHWVRVARTLTSNHYGLPLSREEDVSSRLQAMLDAAYAEGISDIFFGAGTYFLNVVNVYPGMHLHGESGTRFKKTANAGKFDRMFTTQAFRYVGKSDSPMLRFSDLQFDGSLVEQGAYQNYELEHQAMIFVSAREDSPGRLRVAIENCHFENGVGDAIHIYRNVDAQIRNCTATNVFRGGVTITGGNTTVMVDSLITRGDLHPTGVDVEIDGAGYGGSYVVNVTMTNLDLAGDLDIAVREGQFFGQNIYCGGSPVYIAGRNGQIVIEDSELHYSLQDPMRIVIPHDVQFRRCTLVAHGTIDAKLKADPGIMVQWNAGGSQRKGNTVRFEECAFSYERPKQRSRSKPAAALYNNASDKDDRNALIFQKCTFSREYDYGIYLNQGGLLTMDSCTIEGPNGVHVGSSNNQRAHNYRVTVRDLEMRQSSGTAVEYKDQERNEIVVEGKPVRLKPIRGRSKTIVRKKEK